MAITVKSAPRPAHLAAGLLATLAGSALAADRDGATPESAASFPPRQQEPRELPPTSRTSTGISYATPDEQTTLHLWLRAQFRYSAPFDDDPRTPQDFDTLPGGELAVSRARLKAGGHILAPRFEYYFEHELAGDPRLLDLRADLQLTDELGLRIGQYKVSYNRERVDSSGAQQFVERSIATRAFTLDRQRGITVVGRLGETTGYDSSYFVGVFAGDGRDPDGVHGDGYLWVARYQWNFAGEPLPFSQSDIRFSQEPAGTLAFGAARVEGPYTRFSSDGGGQLDGFEPGSGDRYVVEQWLQEFAWQYNGVSLQQEFHVKDVEDTVTGRTTRLDGGYAQVGKAWLWSVNEWTRPVELAFRYARVDFGRAPTAETQTEATLGLNLFFAGHENKLSFDVSSIAVDPGAAATLRETRWRLQWDVSF